jgi:hypothetical protein
MECSHGHFKKALKSFRAIIFIAISLVSIHAFGLTADQIEAEIRAATSGCPDFNVTPPAVGSGLVVDASTFGVNTNNTGAQNYTDFLNAIAYCKNKSAYKLTIPPGTYFIGNYGSHYGNGILYFNGLHDFLLDGQGSTFICQSKSDFIEVMNCSRVAFENYTMNWDWSLEPVQSLVQVTNIDPSGNYVEFQYPYESNPATNSLLYEFDEVDGTNYDFSHQGIGVIGLWQMDTNKTAKVAAGRLRYYDKTAAVGNNWFNHNGVKIGQYFILRHYSYEYPGNDVENNNNLTFSNVTVYSTLGMGYSLNNNKYYQFIDSRLIREPGSIYHLSSASDGINVSKSYGYFKIENDEIDNAGDDSINIHDGISQGVRVTGANTLVASNAINWRNPYSVGDIIELRRGDFSPWNWSSTVTSSSYDSGLSQCTLSFADNLPGGLTGDSILFNHQYDSGNYVISGCYVHDNKGKGAFVHTANGTIENNQFIRNYNPGLFMLCVAASYAEGYSPSNIMVQSNTFDGNNIERTSTTDSSYPNDVVIAGQTTTAGIVDYPICRNIIFQYNLVKNSAYAGMEIASATNILVKNNTFENPNLENNLSQVLGCIMVLDSSGIVFNDNDLMLDPDATSYKTNIYIDDLTATNNVFVDPFASVTTSDEPPVIENDIAPIYSSAYIGDTNTLSIAVSGSAPFGYQWYSNGAPVGGATNSDYQFSVLAGTNTYYCAVTNGYSGGVSVVSHTAAIVGIPIPSLNPADFGSQLKITFSGYNRPETLRNFQVLVKLGTNIPGFSYAQFASAQGADLRFTDAGGTREIPYEINQWNPGGISTVWVQLPALSGTNDFIRAYWGNSSGVMAPAYSTNGSVWLPPAFEGLSPFEAVYHLEQTAPPYLDSTLQYPATTSIAPGLTSGVVAAAGSFTRTPYLDAGSVNLGDQFTLSSWVNVSSSVSDIQCIWANGPGVANSAEIFFYVNSYKTSDGTLILTSGNGSAGTQLKSAAGAVGLDQWHLVTAAVDRADALATLYVDGNQVASGTVRNDFPINNDMDLARDTGGSFAFSGSLDEARIRSGLSSPNWIWASYMTVAQNSAFETYSPVSDFVMIGVERFGNQIVLTWPVGTLQSAEQPTGPYDDVPGAMSPYTNSVSQAQQFYRVRMGSETQ